VVWVFEDEYEDDDEDEDFMSPIVIVLVLVLGGLPIVPEDGSNGLRVSD
jgi:hypothetical protein